MTKKYESIATLGFIVRHDEPNNATIDDYREGLARCLDTLLEDGVISGELIATKVDGQLEDTIDVWAQAEA